MAMQTNGVNVFIDAITNEVIEIALTDDEIAEMQLAAKKAKEQYALEQKERAAAEAKKAAAQAKLAALGLTTEDLEALGL
jgi:hypothetical protein